MTSIGSANAKGIRQATAPIVVLAEDHAFPAPGWAEALIAAHRYPWAAVGPVICNSNDPQNVIAWADFLIAFGEFLCPCESEVVERLPGNNSSYKRDLLLEYGSRLESMMETEALLQKDLQRKGYQLYLESGAQVFHLNFERMISFLSVKYLSGRVLGATRASDWSMFYRLYYVCGTPLIPLVCYLRLRKRWKHLRGDIRWPFRVLPLIWCGLLINATGEMIGCCFGAGQSVKNLSIFEFHRLPHLQKPGGH